MGKHDSHNSLVCLNRIFKLFLSVFKYSWTGFYKHTHTHTHDHWIVFGVSLISCVSHFILKTELSIRNLATVAGASDFEWSVETVKTVEPFGIEFS